MKQRIGIIGHFGFEKNLLNGQSIKTNTFYSALKRYVNEADIITVDTCECFSRPIDIFVSVLRCFTHCEKIVVMLAANGRRYLFPALMLLNTVYKRELFHNCIGGSQADEATQSKILRRCLNSFNSNWVESRLLVDRLAEIGVTNALYIPNFKDLTLPCEAVIGRKYAKPYPLCFLSRVSQEKGVANAIQTVAKINDDSGSPVFTLDVFGPVEKSFEETFNSLLEKYSPYINYKGVVSPEMSSHVLSNYFAFVFPTEYEGEGMPGAVIDALASGTPVLSSHWRYYDDVLADGITGYSYDFYSHNELENLLLEIASNPSMINCLRRTCAKEAKKYTSDAVMPQILSEMRVAMESSSDMPVEIIAY